jgi:hypothetical protein
VSREEDGGINDTAAGILTGVGLQALMIPIAIGLALVLRLVGVPILAYVLPLWWGVSQMIYMGPAIVRARIRGNVPFSNGLCIAAIAVCIIHVAVFVAFQYVESWE